MAFGGSPAATGASSVSSSARAAVSVTRGLQPADEIEEVVAAALPDVAIERQRLEQLDALVADVEAGRHDADDGRPGAVDLDRAVRSERASPPNADCHSSWVRTTTGAEPVEHVARLNGAPARRLHAERVEQARGHRRGDDAPRPIGGGDVVLPGRVGADGVEALLPLGELQVLGRRHPELIEARAPGTGW